MFQGSWQPGDESQGAKNDSKIPIYFHANPETQIYICLCWPPFSLPQEKQVGVWRRTRTVSRYHQEENLMSPPNLDSMEGRSRINCDFSSMVYYNWKVEVVLNILLWKSGTRHLDNKSRTALKSIHHILWNPKPNFLALNYLSSVAPSWLINHSLLSHKVLTTIPQPSTCSLLTPSRKFPFYKTPRSRIYDHFLADLPPTSHPVYSQGVYPQTRMSPDLKSSQTFSEKTYFIDEVNIGIFSYVGK